MEGTVEKRVRDIIVDALKVDETSVIPTAKFVEDLGADSLDQIVVVMGLEEEFNIEISDEDAEKMPTVGEAIEYIKKKCSAS